jgi:hypothetical protein
MKRITITNGKTYLTALQDEILQTRDIRYYHRLGVLRASVITQFSK